MVFLWAFFWKIVLFELTVKVVQKETITMKREAMTIFANASVKCVLELLFD